MYQTIYVLFFFQNFWKRYNRVYSNFRRMYNDADLTNIEFHEHVEVVDLSTCSIDLQPHLACALRRFFKNYVLGRIYDKNA